MLEILLAAALVCNLADDQPPSIFKTEGYTLQAEYPGKKGGSVKIFSKPLTGFFGDIERTGIITIDDTRSTIKAGVTYINHDGKPSGFSQCTLVK